MVQLASFYDRFDSKNPMTQVLNPARLIALLLGCLLVGQSVLPFAAYGASEARDSSGMNEAADILGVRSNVDRILALQAAGGAPSEELLWNKAFVLKNYFSAIWKFAKLLICWMKQSTTLTMQWIFHGEMSTVASRWQIPSTSLLSACSLISQLPIGYRSDLIIRTI